MRDFQVDFLRGETDVNSRESGMRHIWQTGRSKWNKRQDHCAGVEERNFFRKRQEVPNISKKVVSLSRGTVQATFSSLNAGRGWWSSNILLGLLLRKGTAGGPGTPTRHQKLVSFQAKTLSAGKC
jgi:hypothetical protein